MMITFDDLIDNRDTINLNYRSINTSKAISTTRPDFDRPTQIIILHNTRFIR